MVAVLPRRHRNVPRWCVLKRYIDERVLSQSFLEIDSAEFHQALYG